MIKWFKKFFRKEIITTIVVEFQPVKRGVDKNIMFASEAQAKQFFNLVYDNMVQYFLNQEQEKALVCQNILRDIKVLSDIHWSRINFNVNDGQIISTNTHQ